MLLIQCRPQLFTSLLSRGTLITDAPTSRQVLLERLHKSIYGDTLYATMSVAKGMVRLDRDRTGKITLKDFKTALKVCMNPTRKFP